ncbi:MAG: sulfatase [Nitrospirota bacterium]
MSKGIKRPKKIFLISIDTLRADHLGCYGYGKQTSPNLDRLAGEGVLYPYAFSPCPYTVPTHTSQLTGRYPINNSAGFAQKSGKVDQDGTIFLQEIMREQGYATGAFVSCLVLRADWGLSRGYEVYDALMTSSEINRPHELIRDGRETNKAALRWIRENKDRDLFVWLHYFDVHGPYSTPGFPATFRPEGYGDSPVLLNKVREGQPGGIPEYQLLDAKKNSAGEIIDFQKDMRHYLAGYDGGIVYEDTVIGEFFDGLKREGIYEESAIIVTADHGEAMGENGVYFFHGLTVTPEQSHVPLIIKPAAGSDAPASSEWPVSSVDIMPTILDWIEFPHQDLGIDGVSLFTPEPDRFILSENEWQRAVIWRDYYLVREKDAVFDGFCYYFDSQGLCRGTKLFEYKKSKTLSVPQDRARELLSYSEALRKTVDPIERWMKDKDRIIEGKNRLIFEKDQAIAGKDSAIADRDEAIALRDSEIFSRDDAIRLRDRDLADCRGRLAEMEKEVESVYESKSWKLTYPIRWFSARLKGLK